MFIKYNPIKTQKGICKYTNKAGKKIGLPNVKTKYEQYRPRVDVTSEQKKNNLAQDAP